MRKIYSALVVICTIVFGAPNYMFAESLMVADGTSSTAYYPVYGNYADYYQHVQIIYSSADLAEMAGQNITGMTFYLHTKASATWTATFKISVKETDDTDFGDATYPAPTFKSTTGLTTIYTGSLDATKTTIDINFSSPFAYSGGNLLFDLQITTPGNYKDAKFYSPSTIYSGPIYCIEGHNSTSLANIASSNYQSRIRPKTTFTYEAAGIVTCPKPTNLIVADISATSANITWKRKGTETAWNLQYSSNGGSTWTTLNLTTSNVSVVGDDCSYTLTGLTAQTTYKIQVQADCGSGDLSSYSSSTSFTTPCTAKSIPWSCDFGSMAIGSSTSPAPECWDMLNTNEGAYPYAYVAINSGYYVSGGTNSKSLYFQSSSSKYSYIILPEFETPISQLKASFYYRNEGTSTSNGIITIGYMTDPSNGSSFTAVSSCTRVTTMTQVTNIKFTSAPANARIAFRYGGGSGNNYYASIDNINIESALNCTATSVTSITEKTATSAKLTWTSRDGVSSYHYCVVPRGDAADWSEDLSTTNNFVTVTGLTPGDYDFYVKCDCGDNPTSSAYPFTLECADPGTPTFSSPTADGGHVAWTAASSVTTYQYCVVASGAAADWSGNLTVNTNSKDLTGLTTGNNYTFYVRSKCAEGIYSDAKSCSVSPACPTPTGITFTNQTYNSVRVTWTNGGGETAWNLRYKAGSGSWSTPVRLTSRQYDLTGLTSGVTYTVQVQADCDGTWASNTYTPVCNTPGAITLTNQTYNSVRVTWAASGTEDSWNLRYRKGSDSWTERNGLTSRQCDLTGLVAGEEYTIEVTAACCTSGTRSTTYTPVCPTPGTITLSNKTHSSVRVTWAAGGTEDSWNLRYKAAGGAWSDDSGAATGLTTKQYDITGLTSDVEYTIEVSAGCCTGSARSTTYTPICATPASATVSAVKDATASASWSAAAGTGITTFQYIVVPRDATPDWSAATTKTSTSATLSGLTVATNYDFYVRSKCADGNFSESLKRQFTTTAQQPGTITVNSVTSDGGRFSWTAGGAETQYQWKTSAAGSDWSEPLPAGTRTVTVTGLNPTTTYTFYVRSYYSAGVQSAARSTSFTTTCGAESMPFIEDFNSIAELTIPTCWDNTEGTTTVDRYKWTGYLTGRSGKCVRFDSYTNSTSNTNFLKTPPIDVDKEASLFFWYKNPTGGDFSVYYSIDGGAQTLLKSGLTGKTAWTQATYALPAACVGHKVTIIFKGTSNYGSGDAYIYLDDVEVKNCDPSTIYFDAGDGTPASTSLTASRCTGIELPTVSGQCDGWTLAGWATEPVMEATSSLDATIYAAGSRYYPLVDTDTLYAVYSKAIGTSNNYARVNTPSEITLGSKYIIVYYYSSTNYAMSSTLYYSTYSPNGKSVTPNGSDIITTTDATIIWQISGSSLSNCTISNTASNKYLSFKKVSNEVAFASPSDGDNFTIAQNTTSLFSIKSNSSVSYPYLVGSSNTFTNSSSNSNSKFKIYKNVTTYSYTSYPCSKEVLAAEWEEIGGDNFSIVESLDYDGSPTIKSTLHIAAIEPATEGRYSLQYTARPGDHIVIGWGSDMYRIEVPYIATSSITPEVPTGKDLHILPGATFTVSSDMTLHNVSVYGDGELIVGSGSTLTVDTLILCAEQSRLITLSAPEVTINGTLNITTNTLLHDRRIDYHEYYMMTLPFDSRLSDIQYAGLISKTPIAAPIYYTDYFMQYYDTETRNEDAESGERAILGGGSGESYLAPTYWTHVVSKDNLDAASTYVLKAGRGYTIGISDKSDAHSMRTLRFKMTVPSGWNNAEKGLSDKVTDIVASPATSGDFQRLHSGWNLIGNPYLHNYSTGSATASSGLVTGTYILDPLGVDGGDGRYHLSDEGTDVPYITFFDYSWGTYYQTRVSETTFKTFAAAFIQVADGNEQLCFSTPIEAQSAMPAYRRVAQKGKVTYTGINLYNEQNNTSDNTGLVISDDYTTDYETGADLAKMRGNNSLAVFSITNKTELAYNAIDEDYASKTIPLGVCLPQNGEYTLTFDDMRYNVADVKEIILTDYQENTSVNLLWEDYSFIGNKGTDNKRFALTVVLPQNSPSIATDVETASNEKPYCYGTSEGIVCNVAEQYSIYVFDMTGKKVAGLTNVNGKQHIRLANGIYNVMVCTPTTQHTQRCVVR